MADVTRPTKIIHLNAAQRFTSAQRALVWKIQDLCMDVSLHSPTHVASFQYYGHTHEVNIRVVPRDAIGPGATYAPDWTDYFYLPGGAGGCTPNIEQALAAVYERLLAYLPPQHSPGGAA